MDLGLWLGFGLEREGLELQLESGFERAGAAVGAVAGSWGELRVGIGIGSRVWAGVGGSWNLG